MKYPKHTISLIALSMLGSTAALQGNLLFDGALDYINPSTNLPFAGSFAAGVTSHSGSAAYNLSSSLIVNAQYGGPAVYGGVYGFSEADTAGNAGVVGVARGEGDNPDLIRFQSPIGGGTVAQVLNGALLFGTSAASLSEFSSFASDMRMALGGASGNYAIHWMVVGNGGTSYVSQATTGAMTADFAEFSIVPASTAWSVAAPDAEMALSGLDFSIASGDINNVTHVGVYLTAGTTAHTFDLQTFAAVPEPSTYAALLGVLALGCVAWRRRRS